MAHFKSSRPEKAPKSAKVACCICGKKDIEAKMKREPPVHGPFVHQGECRDKKKAQDKN